MTGGVSINSNPLLQTFSMPELTKGGVNSITNNPVLQTFSMPELTEVAVTFSIINNANLTSIVFAKLEKIDGSIVIQNNPVLKSISFAKLQSIGGARFYVTGNAQLESLSMPSLTTTAYGQAFTIYTNPLLTLLDFSSLQILDAQLHMYGNGAGLSCAQLKQACANTKRTNYGNACNSAQWTTGQYATGTNKGKYGHQLTTC